MNQNPRGEIQVLTSWQLVIPHLNSMCYIIYNHFQINIFFFDAALTLTTIGTVFKSFY